MAVRFLKFYLLFLATLILFDGVFSTNAAIIFILRLPGLINSIYTEGRVRVFCLLFQDAFEVTKPLEVTEFLEATKSSKTTESLEATEPSETTDLALIKIVIGRLRLLVCLLAIVFFLDCCYYQIVSMKVIKFIIASDYEMFGREVRLGGLLLDIDTRLDKTSLYTLISYLLPITSLLISLI